MTSMEKTVTGTNFASIQEMGNYQQQLLEKYKNLNLAETKANPDNQALMTFNGYYALSKTNGDFFAIDSNMIYVGSIGMYYTVDLLISMTGITPARVSFTGTFDGKTLTQTSADGWMFNLVFTRTDGSDGTTATFKGTVTPPKSKVLEVTGTTYNNLIPSTLFAGKYYVAVPPASEVIGSPLMQLTDTYEVFYDNGSGSGLKQVQLYVYNMNMYYFTMLTVDLQIVYLIMGSAAEGGLACNDINLSSKEPRSLQTIQQPPVPKLVSANANSAALAAFSGYYQMPSIAAGAFISIEGEYTTSNGSVNLNMVKIGVSYDGVTSFGYYLEADKMTFENNTLTMNTNEQSITLTFTRGYNSSNGSLVSVSGTMNQKNVTGYTLFNPVPLTAFGGSTMTNKTSDSSAVVDSLTINSNMEVVYNKVIMNDIIYVPVMYILASPAVNSKTMMSFGTNGLKGNTCIITDPNGMKVVSANPGA